MIRQRKPANNPRTERQIITGMISSTRFLKNVIPLIQNGGEFQTEFARHVSVWCVEYYDKYEKAPREQIEDLFLSHKKKMQDDQIQLIKDFLVDISQEFEKEEGKFNAPYILDKAEEYFAEVTMKNFAAEINAHVTAGRFDEAEKSIGGYKRPYRPQTVGVRPIQDESFIESLHVSEEDDEDIIIKFPGMLGQAVGPLKRGYLMAFQAESGVGKTWWLWFITKLAIFNGYNVPFLSLEMSNKQMATRMWQDLMGAPITEDDNPVVEVPELDCKDNQDGTCDLRCRRGAGELDLERPDNKWVTCHECSPMDETALTTFKRKKKKEGFHPQLAIAKRNQFERTGLLQKWGTLDLASFPENSFTTTDMFNHVDNLEYIDGIIADMVVSDYADKHKWEIPQDPRNSIGRIWADYKRMAQEKHVLMVTASQSNTERNPKAQVGKGSWAENIEKRRKLDLGLALNQTEDDYNDGIMWVTVDKMRHGDKVVQHKIAVTQCLTLGHPYLDSCLVTKKY